MENTERVYQTLDLIERHLNEELRTDDLAASAFFSKYHFQRLFRRVVGDSVMEYIRRRRLSLASEEICTSNATILEIALKYGYSSNESFTRAFKAYHGTNPSRYRKYQLFRTADKTTTKEQYHMLNDHSKDTRTIIRNLNGFVVQAKQLAEQTDEFAKKQERLKNFEIIAGETSMLADRVLSGSHTIDSLQNSFSEISCRFQMTRALEDMAAAMDIINFSVQLQISRTVLKTREAGLDEIGTGYMALTKLAQTHTNDSLMLLNGVTGLIHRDIRGEILAKIANVKDLIDTMCKRAEEAIERILEQAEMAGEVGKNYMPLSEEVIVIRDEYREISKGIGVDELPDDIDELRTLLERIVGDLTRSEDHLVRANMLVLAARLDCARAPQEQFVVQITELVEQLAAAGSKTQQDCISETAEARDLAVLLVDTQTDNGEKAQQEETRRIFFKCNLLNFSTKTEFAKVSHVLDQGVGSGVGSITDEIDQLTARIRNADTVQLSEITGDMMGVYENLIGFYDRTGKRFAPFMFLANEYKDTADRSQDSSFGEGRARV